MAPGTFNNILFVVKRSFIMVIFIMLGVKNFDNKILHLTQTEHSIGNVFSSPSKLKQLLMRLVI